MSFSQFGDKFTQHSGISRLMEDMGEGLRTSGTIMLGGGNPAQIPAMNDYFNQLLMQMHQDGQLSEALCNYDGPRGKALLLDALAKMLREELGWQLEMLRLRVKERRRDRRIKRQIRKRGPGDPPP